MFLFSTTFFPITVYPEPIQIAVKCLPLYHGIELMRAFTSGAVTWGILGHVAYFAIMVALGGWFAARRLGKLLLT
jgi:lipooligosaccharide transport system permease protein